MNKNLVVTALARMADGSVSVTLTDAAAGGTVVTIVLPPGSPTIAQVTIGRAVQAVFTPQ